MSDAPLEALNFFEASEGSPTNIDAEREAFETEEDSPSIPTIDMMKDTFEDELTLNDGQDQPNSPRTSPRRSLFILLDEPDSSPLARAISVMLMLMIFASSVSFVMETTESVQNEPALKKKLHVRLVHHPCLPSCHSVQTV